MFNDESRFTLKKANGRVRVYRRVWERYSDACVTKVDRFHRGSVMVWGGINHQGKTDLVVIRGNLNAQGYINDVLRPVVVPFINNQKGPVIFLQDNARQHTAHITTKFLQVKGATLMSCSGHQCPQIYRLLNRFGMNWTNKFVAAKCSPTL